MRNRASHSSLPQKTFAGGSYVARKQREGGGSHQNRFWLCHIGLEQATRPTNNAQLSKLRPELRRRNLVDEHRLSKQDRRRTCEKRACNAYAFRLSFHFCTPPPVGWERGHIQCAPENKDTDGSGAGGSKLIIDRSSSSSSSCCCCYCCCCCCAEWCQRASLAFVCVLCRKSPLLSPPPLPPPICFLLPPLPLLLY